MKITVSTSVSRVNGIHIAPGRFKILRNAAAKAVGILASLAVLAGSVHAGIIYVPNGTFASPAVPPVNPYAAPDMDSWQKSPQPVWYDPNADGPWADLMGEFYNVPNPSTYITNCVGTQAAFLFALPQAAIFQDYDSIGGTNSSPTHAFNAKFNVGRTYTCTVGVLGGGGGMAQGATLVLSLYYLDASNNMVTVAATTVTNTTATFPTNTAFVDFSVVVPTVNPGDAWAGKNLGIQIASTVDFSNYGGYWDLDNVRLVESIAIPNFSFETPAVPPVNPYAGPDMDAWQKSPQPVWYDPNADGPWADLMGEFYNVPNPGTYIDNCDGVQASFLFALPQVAIFQDYESIGGTNSSPTHAFDVAFTPGKTYALTVGVIGGGGGMYPGETLQLSLYYYDAATNMITVGATTVTNTTNNFPTNTHFVDFSVLVPGVKPTDPWAGKNLGIQLASTVDFSLYGGYWDVDNVRLLEQAAPALGSAGVTNGAFNLTLLGEPGFVYDLQATTNLLNPASWSVIATITNTTGANVFSDTSATFNQRYYRLRQVTPIGATPMIAHPRRTTSPIVSQPAARAASPVSP